MERARTFGTILIVIILIAGVFFYSLVNSNPEIGERISTELTRVAGQEPVLAVTTAPTTVSSEDGINLIDRVATVFAPRATALYTAIPSVTPVPSATQIPAMVTVAPTETGSSGTSCGLPICRMAESVQEEILGPDAVQQSVPDVLPAVSTTTSIPTVIPQTIPSTPGANPTPTYTPQYRG